MPGIGDVQECFELYCCIKLPLLKSHSQGSKNGVLPSWDFFSWVHFAEGGNSLNKNPGDPRAVRASGGAT